MTDEVHGEDYRGKDRDKDQQAPTSAQTIFAEKNLVEGRLAVQVVLAAVGISVASWSKGRLVQKIVLLSGIRRARRFGSTVAAARATPFSGSVPDVP